MKQFIKELLTDKDYTAVDILAVTMIVTLLSSEVSIWGWVAAAFWVVSQTVVINDKDGEIK